MENISFEAPRGMRDFYPAEMRRRSQLFDAFRKASEAHGFAPYDACVVESLDLLERKSGEEVSEQIYAFNDKSGRRLALRPEMTPTLARMIAAKQGSLQFPLKWTAIAQCFRYERMTRGRKREHYQWNLDIIGESSIAAEAEILGTAVQALDFMGLPRSAYRIHVNSRALLAELLEASGIAADRHATIFLALDKRGKIPDSEIAEMLGNDSAALKLLAVKTLEEAEALLPNESASVKALRELFTIAQAAGFAGVLEFDISVIRGLSYYTGIVFEAFDTAREFRAIFGGGRYDNLLTAIGGAPTPAVGLGFGDVVIGEVIKAACGDSQPGMPPTTAVGFMFEEQRIIATRAAAKLRSEGKNVDLALAPEKPKRFFSRASASNFEFALIIGPDDVAAGVAQCKQLSTREILPLSLKDLI